MFKFKLELELEGPGKKHKAVGNLHLVVRIEMPSMIFSTCNAGFSFHGGHIEQIIVSNR